MDRAMGTAWRLMWGYFGALLVGAIVLELPGAITSLAELYGAGWEGLSLIVAVPVALWLNGGWIRLRLGVVDGGLEPNAMFSAGPWFYRLLSLGGLFLVLIVVGAIGAMGLIVASAGTISSDLDAMDQVERTLHVLSYMWPQITLLSIAIVVVDLRLRFAWLLVVDKDMWGWSAMLESWRLTRGLFWELLGLELMRVLALLAGLLVLIVGAIPASLWGELLWAAYYRQVVDEEGRIGYGSDGAGTGTPKAKLAPQPGEAQSLGPGSGVAMRAP